MDQDIDTIEQSFEDIPEEVKHYIYSDVFINSFNNFCKEQEITGENYLKLKSAIYSYIAQVDTEDNLVTCVNSVSKSTDSNQAILNWISENVAEKILSIVTDTYIDTESSEDPQEIGAPSPVQAIASIKERLSQASNITPTKRDYSVDRPESSSTVPQDIVKPKIDPYRELPEK